MSVDSRRTSGTTLLERITGAGNQRDARFRLFVLVTGTLVVLAMTYGSGMRRQKDALQAKGEETKAYKRDLRLAQLELRARDASVQQWEARRKVALALAAAEKNDPTAARAFLADAAVRLKTAESSDAVTVADLPGLAERLGTLALTPEAIRSVATAMDKALDNIVPEPSSLTAVTVKPPNANDVPRTPAVPGNEVLRR